MANKTFVSKKNGLNYRSAGANAQEEIAKIAYQFFIERGCEHGHDQEDWLRAEQVVRSRRS